MKRRAFLASMSAFLASSAAKADVTLPSFPGKASGTPNLKVGIVSDTHVAFRWQKEKLAMLKKVLRRYPWISG